MSGDEIDMMAVNQPKGTKNESNSQLNSRGVLFPSCCKSTQRYKERKQFTTKILRTIITTCCKSTQRYKERKQFTTDLAEFTKILRL